MAIELPHPIGFVLGGGGSLGAAQAGMLRALDEVRLRPDLVVGTSVGAVNGALLADDPEAAVERLDQLWRTIRKEQVFPGRVWRQFLTLRSNRTFVFDSMPLADFIRSQLRASTIEQLAVPYAAMAVDAETAEPVMLRTGLVVDAVLASSAIPGIYPPVWRNGHTLYDGGLVANVPMRQALALGARSLVVLDCAYPGQSWPLPDTMADVLTFVLTVSVRQQAALELPAVSQAVPVVYLPGPTLSRISPLDFDHSVQLYDGAYRASRAFLADLVVDGPGLYGALFAPRPEPSREM